MKRKRRKLKDFIDPPESDATFAFIAGYTSGGAPFGTTWEEQAEIDKLDAEMAAKRRNRQKRTIHVDMSVLEFAFQSRSEHVETYLDTESGKCVTVPGYANDCEVTAEVEAVMDLIHSDPDDRFLLLESDSDVRPSIDDARKFVRDVEDEPLRKRLSGALGQRRGAFRRFFEILDDDIGEMKRWQHFSRVQTHENIAACLNSEWLEVKYEPLPPYQPGNVSRQHLLDRAVTAVHQIRGMAGVERIALIGSITTPKKEPPDIDLLVIISTSRVVPEIAAAGRKFQGHAQHIDRGAEIFLATPTGT